MRIIVQQVKIIEHQLPMKESQFQNSHFSTFFRSNSQFGSKLDASKHVTFNNTYATIITDLDQQREEEPKVELQLPESIMAIASKRQNERSSTQNSTVLKYLIRKGIFRLLTEKLSLDVVKNMIRHGNLKLYNPGEVFLCQGRRIRSVDLLLFGEGCIISHLQTTPQEQQQKTSDNVRTLDQLIDKLGRQTKKFKLKAQVASKKVKNQLEKSLLFRKENINISDDLDLSQCQKIHPEAFLDFQPLFQYQPKHSKTVAAVNLVTVFSIPLQVFYQSLLHSYNSQLNQKLKFFRKVSIFDAFQNSKLKTLIERLEVREVKKNEFIYREGEEPTCFYMLLSGEVEISKTIDIFSENPNNLYKNRIQVSRERINQQIKILPYANFNGVYNYQPEQKVITLAQITPICIFGEEEIIEAKKRQVNAKVLTLSAQIYQISLDIIEELCSKVIGPNGQKKMSLASFLQMMEESVTLKKILFRQNQLSDLVSYENKSKYSTLFEPKPSKRSRSYKLAKAHMPASSTEIQSRKTTRNSFSKPEEAPPQFNNFNFTDFLKDGSQEVEQVSRQLNEEEVKVVRLTHVKFSDAHQLKNKEKSIRLRSFSRELSTRNKATLDSFATVDSISTKITLQQPLFTVNYFEKQLKNEKKLYVQAKKKRLQNIYKNSPERVSRH